VHSPFPPSRPTSVILCVVPMRIEVVDLQSATARAQKLTI
jgi:hypothetical protein